MKRYASVMCVLAVVGMVSATWALPVSIPMNAQINVGGTSTQSPSGNAIYPAFNSDTQAIYADGALEPEGFTRHNMTTTPGGWWYQYLDLKLAGIPGVDLSAPDATISFQTRYFQDAETNTNPYGDAPVFLRAYSYADDGNTLIGYRDYGIVYATQAPLSNPPYPAWTTVTVNVAGGTDSGLVASNVNRIRWYGTDWSGGGFDFVDFKNVVITPEPATMILLGLGGLLLRRRRA